MGESITRREFTLKSALAMLAGTTITLAGCESDSPTAPTNTPSAPMVVTSIGSNHGHEAELSTADLTQTTITLDIQGSSSHPHSVELSMADLQSISNGTRVSGSSTNDDGHSHGVTFELVS